MSQYIEPRDGESKESFLDRVGVKLTTVPHFDETPDGHAIVRFVKNPVFSVAAVHTSQMDMDTYSGGQTDTRPTTFYHVPIDHLVEALDEHGLKRVRAAYAG